MAPSDNTADILIKQDFLRLIQVLAPDALPAIFQGELKLEQLISMIDKDEENNLNKLCGIQPPQDALVMRLSEFDLPRAELNKQIIEWSAASASMQRIRGYLADAAFRYYLKKNKIIHLYNEYEEKDSGILNNFNPWELTDFYLKNKTAIK